MGPFSRKLFCKIQRLRSYNYAKVISGYNPDIACIVETWLREGEEVEFEGYYWVSHNRGQLNKNAVRESGGVGLLVKHTMYNPGQ